MGLEGGPRLMKISLIAFNALVLIGGAVAIGIGAWSLSADYGADEMSSITGSKMFETACIVVIVAGCVVTLMALLGCCGAFMESRPLLGLFSAALVLMLVLFGVGAILGFVFRDDLEDKLEKEMTKTLKNKYGVDVDNNKDNSGVTDVWNKIQKELKCCGVSGGLNSNTSWFMWQQSEWFKSQITFEKDYVPNSCCNIGSGYTFKDCTALKLDPTMPIQLDPAGITKENPALYSEGCISKVKSEIEDHVTAISVAAAILVFIILVSLMFAVCVYQQLGRQNMIV